jgi:hypothetical protein
VTTPRHGSLAACGWLLLLVSACGPGTVSPGGDATAGDRGAPWPDGGNPSPDGGAPWPDGGNPWLDGGAPWPDGGNPSPDAAGPDAGGAEAAGTDAAGGADVGATDASPGADATPTGPPATLADYWQGGARWELVRRYTLAGTGWPYGYGAGAHLTIVNGTWYLFSRTIHWGDSCGAMTDRLGTAVRTSTDRGVTWSAPVEIIVPRDGTPWACAATDGDAAFDAASGTWHYLFQCLPTSGPWSGCHVERAALDPAGEFVATDANPVIPAGSLWQRICNQLGDDCVSIPGGIGQVYDEGTFNIFLAEGGFYYVSFHGFDGVRGYRGIARTSDFVTWDAGDPAAGVPTDAVLDRLDLVGWREAWLGGGPIGVGAGSILRDGGYFYQITEGADVNLGCTAGQNWDWGMFRSASLTAATWEQLPAGNPFLYSSREPERDGQPLPCNPAYARLVRDPATGETLLHYTRESMDASYAGIYLYRLVRSPNLLVNGDLWMCTGQAWQIFPLGNTNLAVYRLPRQSVDDNCYLATNCGAPSCTPGQSVYQDVDLGGPAPARVAFGGRFASEGGPATVNVVLFQLAADSSIVTQETQVVTLADDTYVSARREVTIAAGAARLRFQIYLQDPPTIRADQMFVDVLE